MKKFGIAILVLTACSSESQREAPQDLIPAEKMISLVVDLQILESHFQRQFNRPDLYKAALDSSSNLVFESYGISRSEFDSSYSWYATDATALYGIYEAALDTVNFRISQGR